MKNPKINILIADDHEMIREGLQVTLNRLEYVGNIIKVRNGKEAIRILKSNVPVDLIISDICMPEIDGIKLCKLLKEEYLFSRIIILAQLKETWLLKDILKTNVKGIILKEDKANEVIKAVRAVLNDNYYYSPAIQQHIRNLFSRKKKMKKDFEINLTKREKEILTLIADENTNTEIASKLFISNKTVDCHRNNILLKFGARNTAGLIKKAIRYGFIE